MGQRRRSIVAGIGARWRKTQSGGGKQKNPLPGRDDASTMRRMVSIQTTETTPRSVRVGQRPRSNLTFFWSRCPHGWNPFDGIDKTTQCPAGRIVILRIRPGSRYVGSRCLSSAPSLQCIPAWTGPPRAASRHMSDGGQNGSASSPGCIADAGIEVPVFGVFVVRIGYRIAVTWKPGARLCRAINPAQIDVRLHSLFSARHSAGNLIALQGYGAGQWN
jgi:hypothetical protein